MMPKESVAKPVQFQVLICSLFPLLRFYAGPGLLFTRKRSPILYAHSGLERPRNFDVRAARETQREEFEAAADVEQQHEDGWVGRKHHHSSPLLSKSHLSSISMAKSQLR